jgi:oligopeptidase B
MAEVKVAAVKTAATTGARLTMDSFEPIAPPPQARRDPVRTVVHETELVDDYAWMRAANWREVLADPSVLPQDIRAHLEAENAYSAAVLVRMDALQTQILGELRGRIREDDESVPFPDGPYDYGSRFRDGGQHEIVGRRRRDGGPEEILLDGDACAAGKPFFDLAAAVHSPDHSKLAWSADDRGSELHRITVRDLSDGRDGAEIVERSDGSVVWMRDSSAFLYVRVDDNHRTAQVFRHRVGSDPAGDQLVLEETDPRWFVSLKRSASARFGIVSMHDHSSTETWLIDLWNADAPALLVAARRPQVRYEVEHRGDQLLIVTNADGAEDFKIVTAPLADPRAENWRDLVAHRRGRMIIDLMVFADYDVRLERENSLPRIVVRDARSGDEHAIAFAEEAYSLRIVQGFEFDTPMLRFVYSSMTTPDETWDYDMATRGRVLRKRRDVPSGHDPARYVTRRLMAKAPDGELVPVSILARADRTGPAPCLLYGYGAYGHSIPAAFVPNRFSLVDRGFVFAIAHIRGGTDKGWHWYEDGKLSHKPNTFSDFVAVARHLIGEGFTEPGRIVAHGGSAGGMLMGAVANLAPELFGGIIADVPFVDVMNTMLDADLPLTPPEWREWGNPIKDATAFRTMLSYSPYDNVAPKAYPAIFAMGGLTDPRVTYWEPAKWVARLRATMTGGGPILLHTNMDAGHGGASGRFDRLKEVAVEQAFALMAVGMA